MGDGRLFGHVKVTMVGVKKIWLLKILGQRRRREERERERERERDRAKERETKRERE